MQEKKESTWVLPSYLRGWTSNLRISEAEDDWPSDLTIRIHSLWPNNSIQQSFKLEIKTVEDPEEMDYRLRKELLSFLVKDLGT
jgi:hypothetical protein